MQGLMWAGPLLSTIQLRSAMIHLWGWFAKRRKGICSGDPESLANILANHHEGPILFLPGSAQEDTRLAPFECGIRKNSGRSNIKPTASP